MNTKIKKILAAALALIMILALAACGGSGGKKAPAEVVGTYTLYEMTSEGEVLNNDIIKSLGMDEAIFLELKADGTGSMTVDGETEDFTWDDKKIKGESLGDELEYTYEDGKLTLTDNGDILVFQKADGKPNASLDVKNESSEVSEPAEGAGSELQQWWSGSWYGWYHQISAYGSWENSDGLWYDCCAEITMDDDTTGAIKIWDETFEKEIPLAECEISFGPGTTSAGAFMSEDGEFIDAAIDHADWIVDPGASTVSQYDHMICIDGSYDDPEDEGGFNYMIYLRPWGMDWEDVAAENEDMLPMYYEDWYLPLIQAEKKMPDKLGE